MQEAFSRTELLIGTKGVQALQKAKVAIFGLGGVGSYVLEALVRAGIGSFILVDSDKIEITNLNRQLLATQKTIGRYKVEVAKERILEINPKAIVEIHPDFFMPDSKELFDESVDYIVDCMDTVTAKIELIVRANKKQIPIISSMGTGNKLDPTKFEVADIYQTTVCPLAKVMRKELRAREIPALKVVYSKEEPVKQEAAKVPASISFVPSVAGLILAGEIIKEIVKGGEHMKEVVIKVEGMMCAGCENRVQNALSIIDGVEKVVADHTAGTVTVTMKPEVEESTIKEKIQDIGYEVKE